MRLLTSPARTTVWARAKAASALRPLCQCTHRFEPRSGQITGASASSARAVSVTEGSVS